MHRQAARPTNRAERELASKAMNMRLWAAAPRDELLAIARRLFGDGELARQDGAESRAYVHVVGCLSLCDDYAAADAAIELMFADARRRGSASMFAAASQLRARQRLWTGPIADAVLDGRAAFDMRRGASQMYQHAAAFCLVSGLLEQDAPEAAEEVLRAGSGQPAAVGFYAAWQQHATGRLAAYRGENEQALEAFLTTGRRLNELLAINPTVLPWRSEAALAAQRLGRHDAGARAGRRGAGAGRAFRRPATDRRGAPRRRAGRARRRGSRAAASRRQRCWPAAAHASSMRARWWISARRSAAPGAPVDARGTLREALALAEATGAGALARRAREELRLAGGRAPAPAEGGSGLTPSEDRVAALAAAGHSNREIADALFVTVKNVEWHLGNVYRKLDIRGRGAARRRARTPGLNPGGRPSDPAGVVPDAVPRHPTSEVLHARPPLTIPRATGAL